MHTSPIERCDSPGQIPEGFAPSTKAGSTGVAPLDDEPPTAPPRAGSGFSLIELLIVMAIMAVMLGMTVALGPSVLRSNAMSGGLSQVASAISLARSEAVRARKPTFFVLAPISPLDERSYSAYSILQADSMYGTNYTYITRWQKLPSGVLFTNSTTPGSIFNNSTSLPYPADGKGPVQLYYLKFAPEGGLDEIHTAAARIALQGGVRISATNSPDWVGTSTETNEVVVQRLSGKVTIERSGEL